MSYVATLVCDPSFPVLTGEMVARASKALANPGRPQLLEPGIAVDIPFDLANPESARTITDRLRAALKGAPADVFVQAQQGRQITQNRLPNDDRAAEIGCTVIHFASQATINSAPSLTWPQSSYHQSKNVA
jgi:hypothetical protein